MKENKGERYTATTHSATRSTQDSWKTLLHHFVSFLFAFFEKWENQLYRVLLADCCCSLSLTLPPRAQYYTVLSNFLFCLSLASARSFVCVLMQHSYIWSKILLSFPFSTVYIDSLFGPERETGDDSLGFCTTRLHVLGVRVYLRLGRLFMFYALCFRPIVLVSSIGEVFPKNHRHERVARESERTNEERNFNEPTTTKPPKSKISPLNLECHEACT